METITPADKMTTKKTTPTAATKGGYIQKAWNTIPHGPIRRGNGSINIGNRLTKKIGGKIQRSKGKKFARLDKDLSRLGE